MKNSLSKPIYASPLSVTKETLAFLGVLSLGLALRLIAIQGRGIWYDDAFSIFLARRSIPEIIGGTAADTMPPLYYLILHFWMGVSSSIVHLRSLSILFSLGALILTYRIILDLFGVKPALWATLFTAISPLQIYHAQEMRMYSLLLLCQLGYCWFFLRVMKQDEDHRFAPADWIGLFVCGALSLYTHNIAVFMLVCPDIYLLAHRKFQLLGKIIVSQLAIGLFYIPWLLYLPGQLANIQSSWSLPIPGLVEILQNILIFHTNLPIQDWLLPVALIISLQVLAVALIEIGKFGRSEKALQLAAVFILFPPIASFIISYIVKPIYIPRGLIASSIFYYGVIGWAATFRRNNLIAAFVGGSLCLMMALALPYQYSFNSFPRSPFLAAVGYLGEEFQSGDVILHDNKLSYLPSQYYSGQLPQEFLPDEPDSPNDTLAKGSQDMMAIHPESDLPSAVSGYKRVFFVVFTETIREFDEMGKGHPNLAWLQANYLLDKRTIYNDLEIYQFSQQTK